jgi:hypothetical protein
MEGKSPKRAKVAKGPVTLYAASWCTKNGRESEFWWVRQRTATIMCMWPCPAQRFGHFAIAPASAEPGELSDDACVEKRLSRKDKSAIVLSEYRGQASEWDGHYLRVNSGYAAMVVDNEEEDRQEKLAEAHAQQIYSQLHDE